MEYECLMKAKFQAEHLRKSVWLFVHILNVLCWPSLVSLLDVQPGRRYLDIACGNGLTSRRLASLGGQVTAFDFSASLIEKARARSANLQSLISYHVLDATDEQALLSLGQSMFDSALSNMALFDMADLEPLFRTLPRLLKPNRMFVFSLTHPAFNNASTVFVLEERDDQGEIQTVYSVKNSRYMTPISRRDLPFLANPNHKCTLSGRCNTISTLASKTASCWMVLKNVPSRLITRKRVRWGGEANLARSHRYWLPVSANWHKHTERVS